MMLLDANLLLYAYDALAEHHLQAREWLEQQFAGTEPVALAWVTLIAFLRVSTHRTALRNPFSMSESLEIVDSWLRQPRTVLLNPGTQHVAILRRVILEGQVTGRLVTDAHLAALALEHGATLCTADRDFSRFAGLKTANPLDARA